MKKRDSYWVYLYKNILLNEVFNLLLWCYKIIYYGNEKIRTIVD